MNELLSQAKENLSFLGITAAVIIALAVISKLTEKKFTHLRHVSPAKRVSIIGICSAIAVVLHILDFPLPFLAPEFYKLDFSEVPVLLGGFFLGPSAAVAIEGIKILLKLLLKSTSTAFVGVFARARDLLVFFEHFPTGRWVDEVRSEGLDDGLFAVFDGKRSTERDLLCQFNGLIDHLIIRHHVVH